MPVNTNEIFPIVDIHGNVIGKATRGECHNGSKILHPVVHLQLFNSRGELYLQKRALHKDIQPGKWDTAVGGHVDYGENIQTALRREAREELGITLFEPVLIGKYIFESEIEKELVPYLLHPLRWRNTPRPRRGRIWSLLVDKRTRKGHGCGIIYA